MSSSGTRTPHRSSSTRNPWRTDIPATNYIVRAARPGDDSALAAIDQATWSIAVSPTPCVPLDQPFFQPGRQPTDVTVVEVAGEVAGYILMGRDFPIPSCEHVLALQGLAVDPRLHRRGIARALIEDRIREAGARGATRLKSRVLDTNAGSLAVHAACGFETEGILRGEFCLDGKLVDDHLLAREVGRRD